MDVTNVAATATVMQTAQVQNQATTAIMKKTMDVAESNSKTLLDNMQKVNNKISAKTIDPGRGNIIDKYV